MVPKKTNIEDVRLIDQAPTVGAARLKGRHLAREIIRAARSGNVKNVFYICGRMNATAQISVKTVADFPGNKFNHLNKNYETMAAKSIIGNF